MIELGSKARDRISGFAGKVVSRHSYISGCDRYSLQPAVGKDGKLPDAQAFDEATLEVTEGPRGEKRPSGMAPG